MHGATTFETTPNPCNVIQTIPPPEPINLSWLDFDELPLENHTNQLPPGIQQITLPVFEVMKVPAQTFVASEIDDIQSEIVKTHLPW